MTPLTTLIMSAVTLGKAGVGSAMNDTTRELGGALGVAVLGSLVTSTYTSSIGERARPGSPTPDRRRPRPGWSVRSAWPGSSAPAAARVVEAAKQAFVDGIGVAAIAGAVVVALAAVIAQRSLPRSGPAVTPVPAQGDELVEEILATVPL